MEHLEQDLLICERKEIIDLWADDKLERMDVARKLTSILSKVKTDKDGFTLVIKSPWGTGKTFFVEKWIKSLQAQDCFCVYFSAWEAEMYDNPAQYFIETFLEAFAKEPRVNSKLAEWIQKSFLKLAKLSLMLTRIVKAPDVIPFVSLDALKKEGHDFFKEWVEEIEKAEKAPTTLPKAKAFLEGIIEELEPIFASKIYVFIDELDRCKPTFSISLIETIKHFFAVKGLIYTLSVDLDQLEGSIKHVYGTHIDCEGYLMRFVSLFYTLPPIPHKLFAKFLLGQLPVTEENKFCISPDSASNKDPLIDLFSACSDAFKASLRDQIMIRNRLELMLSAGKVFLYPTLYLLFVQLRYPIIWQRTLKNNLYSVAPKELHRTLENYRKETNSDFSRESVTTMYQQSIVLFKLELPEIEESLVSELIRLLSTTSKDERASILKEKDRLYVTNRKSFAGAYWLNVIEHQEDFFNQLDLINLYSDGFA